MAFSMKFSKDELKGSKPHPPGIVTVRLVGFNPKKSKAGDSINLNFQVEFVSNDEFNGKKLFMASSLNTKIPNWIQDFVHSFGVAMKNQTTDPEIPGVFDAKPGFDPNRPETWAYAGPLLNKTAQWEVGIKMYKGREQQTVRRFMCAVPNCNTLYPDIYHTEDMTKGDESANEVPAEVASEVAALQGVTP